MLLLTANRDSTPDDAGPRTTIVERVILEATAPAIVIHSG